MNRTVQEQRHVSLRHCLMLAWIAGATALSAQVTREPGLSPRELVQATVKNEVAAAKNTAIKFMFRSHKQTPEGVQEILYVEGNEALASLIVSQNDQPPTPKQSRAEADRLARMISDPDQLRSERAHEKQQVEQTLRIVKALPDAFLYEYAGEESAAYGIGKPGDRLVRLNFKPNPSFAPPSRVEQVLAGMQGYLLIDTKACRIAKLDGTLFKDVTFGWGLFGSLHQGGHFLIKQADVGDGYWAITETNVKVTGRILLLKSLNYDSDEVFSDFRRLPDAPHGLIQLVGGFAPAALACFGKQSFDFRR